jgi:hypothetical protein
MQTAKGNCSTPIAKHILGDQRVILLTMVLDRFYGLDRVLSGKS